MTKIIEIASDVFVCFGAEHVKNGKGERTGGIKAFVPHNMRVIKNASSYTWNISLVRDRNTIPLTQLQQFCWGYFVPSRTTCMFPSMAISAGVSAQTELVPQGRGRMAQGLQGGD